MFRHTGSGRRWRWLAGATTTMLVATLAAGPAEAAGNETPTNIDGQLWAELATGPASFWVYLTEQADLSRAPDSAGSVEGPGNPEGPGNAGSAAGIDRHARTSWVYQQLTRTAEASQADLRGWLTDQGATHTPYWISNVIHVSGDATLARQLAARPDVSQLEPDRTYHLIEPVQRLTADSPIGPAAVEWGIANIGADRVWSDFGIRGEGIVVASIDTGVQHTHPALVNQYRGTHTGSHDYNWFDPAGICPPGVPCDNNNHGTHVTGTMVGDDGGSNQIGVAPGAHWIAAKGCESSSCSSSSLLASGQWMLAPTDVNGGNPDPAMAPDVVNNSWGGGRGDTWYQDTINAWVSAGIFPMFSAGNSGPGCNTANSPGDNLSAYAVGAYDINNNIAGFSSRGFSGVDGATIKPDVSAPGVSVRSSVAGNGYGSFSGTSMASPHAAGTVALIWSAAEPLRGDVAATRTLLDQTATDVAATQCGGSAADNNVFGQGRLNAHAAVDAAPRGPTGTLAGRVIDAETGAGLAGAQVTAEPGGRVAVTGPDGGYALRLAGGTYDVTTTHSMYHSQQVSGVPLVVEQTTTQDFSLAPLPTGALAGTVVDDSSGDPVAGATVAVSGPQSATATTDEDGRYRFDPLVVGTYQLSVAAAGFHAATIGDVVVEADQTTTADVALVPNVGNLTGAVTAASSGTGVPQFCVDIVGAAG
jgi:subtilisin family serine protease